LFLFVLLVWHVRQADFLINPMSQIDHFASLAAEWHAGRILFKLKRLFARWAIDLLSLGMQGFVLFGRGNLRG
jgi:hypothetical protein